MNAYDSAKMADILADKGYVSTENSEDADMIILNTCHIREKASEKMYSELGRLKKFKEQKSADGSRKIVAVAGCVAQAEGERILERSTTPDMVIGPHAYHNLPAFLEKAKAGEVVTATDFTEDEKFKLPVGDRVAKGFSAFLTVQEGCDKFCSFCVVPYTRGAEYSRKVEDILDEARLLVDKGVKEITLLGQNVNAYHGEDKNGAIRSLAYLIEKLAEIKEIFRIRYTTSHPNDMTADLIKAHAEIEKLSPYLHLPVQAGSDKILAAMNRKHTARSYCDVIDRLRAARPDIALSSDFIVGFPGETDKDFQDTLDLVEKVGFASSYSFKYSPRPGTPAAGLDDQIPETEKARRLQALQALLFAQQQEFNRSLIGRSLNILLEKPGRKEGQLIGKSPYLQSIHTDAQGKRVGDIVTILVESASQNALSGQILSVN